MMQQLIVCKHCGSLNCLDGSLDDGVFLCAVCSKQILPETMVMKTQPAPPHPDCAPVAALPKSAELEFVKCGAGRCYFCPVPTLDRHAGRHCCETCKERYCKPGEAT